MQKAAASTSRLSVSTFGAPRIHLDDVPVQPKTRGTTSLLLYLAVERVPHQRQWLAEFLWEDTSCDSARVLLRNALYNLRISCGRNLFRADRESIHIDQESPLEVDVDRFRSLANTAGSSAASSITHRESRAGLVELEPLLEAFDLYRAPFLAGFSLPGSNGFNSWILGKRGELKATLDSIAVRLLTGLHAAGEIREAMHIAERWLQKDPGNEEAHRRLMSLHLAAGNPGAAREQYVRCAEYLRREYESDPSPETHAVYELVLAATVPRVPDERPRSPGGNLPSVMTEVFGRDAEQRDITQALGRSRLVTICGPGGCGKTTMALAVGNARAGEFPDGVWLTELAPISDPLLLTSRISESLGLSTGHTTPDIDTITAFVGKQRLLLILDNGEHVIDAVIGLVGSVLASCPEISFLITSREPLGLPAEISYRLPCLPYPDPARITDPGQIREYAAVRVFVASASRVLPGFTLTEANAGFVARICAAVDGLPLALEMTGSFVEVLALDEILDRSTNVTTGLPATVLRHDTRHQSLNALVAWSYRLLSQNEQLIFRRLSVFRDGWTVAAATAICEDEIPHQEAVDVLIGLVRKSLVQPPVNGRYHMLEPTRQYAAQLPDEEDRELAHRRHCTWCLGFVTAASRDLYTTAQSGGISAIESEYANIRTAIRYAIRSSLRNEVLSFGAALYWYWFISGKAFEGLGYLEWAICGIYPSTAIEARGMAAAAYLCWWVDRQPSGSRYAQAALRWAEAECRADAELRAFAYMAAALAESPPGTVEALAHIERYWSESITLYRSIDHTWGIIQGLLNSSVLEIHSNRPVQHRNYDLAISRLEEAYELALATDNQIDIGKINYWLATALMVYAKDLDSAKVRLEENLDDHRSRRTGVDLAMSMNSLALIHSSENHHAEAFELIRESLTSLRRTDSTANTILAIQYASFVLAKLKLYEPAVRLMVFAQQARRSRGSRTEICDRWLSRVRETMKSSHYTRSVANGMNLRMSDAIDLILTMDIADAVNTHSDKVAG